MKKHLRIFYAVLATFLLIIGGAVVFNFSHHTAIAATTPIGSISGYAWSDNVGWLSFNGTAADGSPYGVTIDPTNKDALSGYAWSDNVGWVSFNPNDVSGCPSGTCQAQIGTNGQITGWARALAAVGRNDGWDGWIDLGSTGNADGGVANSTGQITNYAWGSDVVGWTEFTNTNYSCSSTSICVNGNTQSETVSSTCQLGTPVTCPSGCNSATGQCNNNNQCQPSVGCTVDSQGNQYSTTVNAQCSTSSTLCNNGCNSTGMCNAGGSGGGATASGCLSTSATGCTLTGRVRSGSPIKLYWNIGNVSSCSLTSTSGDNHPGLGASDTAGFSTANITAQTMYTLTCTGSASYSGSVTINLTPTFKEI